MAVSRNRPSNIQGSRGRRSKKRRRNKRKIVILLILLLLAALGIFAVYQYYKYRTFSSYQVKTSLEISNSEENTSYYLYGDGYLKCAGDGLTYFTQDGIIWSENFSIRQPIVDISGMYIAVADMSQRDVYVYDASGFYNRINFPSAITDVAITDYGMIAAALNDDNVNYLQVTDRDGVEILTQKSLFSSSGFLMDLDAAADGKKLAAIYAVVEKGTLRSKVFIYDLSGTEDIIVGSFDDYESVLLTNVEFVGNDRVWAVGDTAMSLFDVSEIPEEIYTQRDFEWEIQSLFFNAGYMGLIAEVPQTDEKYTIKVFDKKGKQVLEQGTDFQYNRVDFAGSNVLLYNNTDCELYSLAGVKKFAYSFGSRIEALKSTDGYVFAYGKNRTIDFIRVE